MGGLGFVFLERLGLGPSGKLVGAWGMFLRRGGELQHLVLKPRGALKLGTGGQPEATKQVFPKSICARGVSRGWSLLHPFLGLFTAPVMPAAFQAGRVCRKPSRPGHGGVQWGASLCSSPTGDVRTLDPKRQPNPSDVRMLGGEGEEPG